MKGLYQVPEGSNQITNWRLQTLWMWCMLKGTSVPGCGIKLWLSRSGMLLLHTAALGWSVDKRVGTRSNPCSLSCSTSHSSSTWLQNTSVRCKMWQDMGDELKQSCLHAQLIKHCHKDRLEWRSSSTILDLSTRWMWVVSFIPWLLYLLGKSQQPTG
jgi:hypothetical protein